MPDFLILTGNAGFGLLNDSACANKFHNIQGSIVNYYIPSRLFPIASALTQESN